MTETIFADGFRFDRPTENAPEFVKGKVSIKVDDAIPFLQKYVNERGYVNIDLLVSKEGKPYFKLNNWKPAPKVEPEDDSSGIPF